MAIFNKYGSFYLLSVRRASGDEIPPAIIIDVGFADSLAGQSIVALLIIHRTVIQI